MQKIERWGVLELSIEGRSDGNPFVDYPVDAKFSSERGAISVAGFYDGNGVYKVRFMPDNIGVYRYTVCSEAFREVSGEFEAVEPSEGNHGPVHIADTFHFSYADGKPYYPFGTTCYVWELQSDELIEKTFETLEKSCFNKIRFCIFPKHYIYNLSEPRSYPFEGTPMDSSVLTPDNFISYERRADLSHFDLSRPNPGHFRHIEKCIERLGRLGIEADIILFHPYDRWGFSIMTSEQDEFYLRYCVARLAAYRNVWWALANEYDLFKTKTKENWRNLGELVKEIDQYNHLRSIHNCFGFYDHTEDWVTHASVQRQDIYKTTEYTNEWREKYQKPVVLDEISYEGNISLGWGNISARELVRRCWEAVCRGGYPQHGETYLDGSEVLWWSHGGTLKGESEPRLRFLYDVLSNAEGRGLKLWERTPWDSVCAVPETETEREYYLHYYGFTQPSFKEFWLSDDKRYEVRVIDTWNMTSKLSGVYSGRFIIDLPSRENMAIEIRQI